MPGASNRAHEEDVAYTTSQGLNVLSPSHLYSQLGSGTRVPRTVCTVAAPSLKQRTPTLREGLGSHCSSADLRGLVSATPAIETTSRQRSQA